MLCAGWTLRSLAFHKKLLLHSRPNRQAITCAFASHNSDKYQNLWGEDFDSIYCLKMPKNKDCSSSDASASSNSSSEDEKPMKKQKTEKVKERKDSRAESSKKSKSSSKDKDEEPTFELGKNKRVTVREFKGQIYVDIREFYDSEGELKPGKKGVSLAVPQFKELVKALPDIEDAVKLKADN